MNNEQFINSDEIVKPKKRRGVFVFITFLILIILGLTGYILYDKGIIFNNNANQANENINSSENNNQTNTNVNNNVEKEITPSELEKNNIDNYVFHLNEILLDNYSFDKEYMNDSNFVYAFVWYDALSNLNYKVESLDANGNVVATTGGVSFVYNLFKEYYKNVTGSSLNINNLDKNNKIIDSVSYPTIKKVPEVDTDGIEKIFGSYITGFLEPSTHLEFSKLTFNESTKIYTIEMKYFNYKDNNFKEKEYLGVAKLKYSMDNLGNKVYKSFIITR